MGRCLVRRTATAGALVAALLAAGVAPAHARTPGWHLLFADFFDTPAALGAFSDCDHFTDTPAAYCGGLPPALRSTWWAYPRGWPDTARQRGLPVGGLYDPDTTVWISRAPDGDGQLHVRMWRGAYGGPVHSATIVPKRLMGLRYGAFEERWRVSRAAPGYKSAHLLWPVVNSACPDCEIDFPEGEWTGGVYAFAHHRGGVGGVQDGFSAHTTWTSWHTSRIEWRPGHVTFRLDGRLVGESTVGVPDTPADWDIQNESALAGATAAPGSQAQLDITYVCGWSWG